MTMPKFEPVATRNKVIDRANRLACNANFRITGMDAHKTGNIIQAILEEVNVQLQQAYESEEQAAIPEGWRLVPIEPTTDMYSAAWQQDGTGYRERNKAICQAMIEASPEPMKRKIGAHGHYWRNTASQSCLDARPH